MHSAMLPPRDQDLLTASRPAMDCRASDPGTKRVQSLGQRGVPASYRMRPPERRHSDRRDDPLRASPKQIGPLDNTNIYQGRNYYHIL